MENYTINYYDTYAEKFMESTKNVPFNFTWDKFTSKLKKGASILDFGCGSGRDTKEFLKRGFKVSAIDGSRALAEYASFRTGIKVRHMLFQDFKDINRYDAIWACASLLHLNKEELKKVMKSLYTSLKKNGIIYLSFKYGDFEGERNGRYFLDMTEDSFHSFIEEYKEFTIEDEWVSNDVRPEKENEKWLNVILRRD